MILIQMVVDGEDLGNSKRSKTMEKYRKIDYHYINLIQVLFTQRLFKSLPLFIHKLKPFLFYNSCLLKYVNRTFKTKYNVYDILENDIDALKARIFYVHDEYVELFV